MLVDSSQAYSKPKNGSSSNDMSHGAMSQDINSCESCRGNTSAWPQNKLGNVKCCLVLLLHSVKGCGFIPLTLSSTCWVACAESFGAIVYQSQSRGCLLSQCWCKAKSASHQKGSCGSDHDLQLSQTLILHELGKRLAYVEPADSASMRRQLTTFSGEPMNPALVTTGR